MNNTTNHAFIVYQIRRFHPLRIIAPTLGFSFAASFSDRKEAENWIVRDGKKDVNYMIMEVFRNT